MADCFYHTGRPSVARCKQCGRPLCGECRIVGAGGIFCIQKCLDSFSVFAQRAEEIEAKRTKPSGVKSLIKLIIFLAVLFILYLVIKKFL